jgi:hypothetical protein
VQVARENEWFAEAFVQRKWVHSPAREAVHRRDVNAQEPRNIVAVQYLVVNNGDSFSGAFNVRTLDV